MKNLLTLLFTFVSFAAQSQTNFAESVPWFRDVNGQLYNTRLAAHWMVFNGKVSKVMTNGIVLQLFKTNNVYESVFVRGNGGPAGAFGSTSDRNVRRLASSQEVPERKIFVKNSETNYVDGERMNIKAMKTGTIKIEDELLEIWDCGTRHRVAK